MQMNNRLPSFVLVGQSGIVFNPTNERMTDEQLCKNRRQILVLTHHKNTGWAGKQRRHQTRKPPLFRVRGSPKTMLGINPSSISSVITRVRGCLPACLPASVHCLQSFPKSRLIIGQIHLFAAHCLHGRGRPSSPVVGREYSDRSRTIDRADTRNDRNEARPGYLHFTLIH